MPERSHNEVTGSINKALFPQIAEKVRPALQEALDLCKASFENLIVEVKDSVKGSAKEMTLGSRLGQLAQVYAEAQKLLLSGQKERGQEMLTRVHMVLHSYRLVAENATVRNAYDTWKGLMYLMGKLVRALGPIAEAALVGLNIPMADVLVEKAVDLVVELVEPEVSFEEDNDTGDTREPNDGTDEEPKDSDGGTDDGEKTEDSGAPEIDGNEKSDSDVVDAGSEDEKPDEDESHGGADADASSDEDTEPQS